MEFHLFFRDVPCGKGDVTIGDRLGISRIRMKDIIDFLLDMFEGKDPSVICPVHGGAALDLCMEKVAKKYDRPNDFAIAMYMLGQMWSIPPPQVNSEIGLRIKPHQAN